MPGSNERADQASSPSKSPAPNTIGIIPNVAQALVRCTAMKKSDEMNGRQDTTPLLNGLLHVAAKTDLLADPSGNSGDQNRSPLEKLRMDERKIVTVAKRCDRKRHEAKQQNNRCVNRDREKQCGAEAPHPSHDRQFAAPK